MITVHNSNDIIAKVSREDITRFFKQLGKCLTLLPEVYEGLQDFENDAISEDDLIDILADNEIEFVNDLIYIANFRVSLYDPLNTYFSRAIASLQLACSNLEVILNTGIAPTDDEIVTIESQLFEAIAGISFFTCYEFKCIDAVLAKDEPDVPVDEIVYEHFSQYSNSQNDVLNLCQEFAIKATKISQEYKLHLKIFDEFPELEREFEAITGPAIGDINPDNLTIEIVRAVCDGTMTVDELLEKCSFSVRLDEEDSSSIAPIKAF